jgi:phytanoyl-CoA hydroxylase
MCGQAPQARQELGQGAAIVNTTITPEQAEYYRQNGYVVVEDFLAPDEVRRWIEVLDGVITSRGDRRLPDRPELYMDPGETERKPPSKDEEYYNKVFVQRVNLWKDSEEVRRLIHDPRMGRMATELTGNDGFRVWHDQALYKAPWANPTAWHVDNAYWSFSSTESITIWIALDDVTVQNGCLMFLPGTHKRCTYDPVPISHQMDKVFDMYPEFRDIEPFMAVMKAGSCTFHNGLTVHGAGPNMTPYWRRAMTCIYMPIGSTFNGKQNILTKAQMAQLNVGGLLDDDELNPVIWERSMAEV